MNMDCGSLDFTVESPFSFAKHSSIGVGGNANVAYYPNDETELKDVISRLTAEGKDFYTLGNLTNVLPPDANVEKAIIRTKRLKEIRVENNRLYVGAGVNSGEFLQACKHYGLCGAEFLTGIPCTMGGAVFMNAGAAGEYLAPFIHSVKAFYKNREITLFANDCRFSYKKSIFMQEKMCILGVTLTLEERTQTDIEQRIAYFKKRRSHLPTGKSMGCVFKNPNDTPAGRLIEGAGLKGMRYGGATVSTQHANFIINDNNATSADVQKLILVIKNAVFAQYKIRLEEEIRYIT